MTTTLAIAGAAGNLGTRIVKAAIARGARVTALVRTTADSGKLDHLHELGATVTTDMSAAVAGVSCVVSAMQGLGDVIVDAQLALVAAARAAGARFIPSDFSTDFRELTPGANRNFDLRRQFHERAGGQGITAIFNGAFAEILGYGSPLVDVAKHRTGYFEDADWTMDFTTMDDTAAFAAAAALDADAPAALRCASFQVSARQIADAASRVFGTPFELVKLGNLDELRATNRKARAEQPEGETQVFPPWQRTQYTQSMLETHHASLDNARYPELTWTSLEAALGQIKSRRS